MIRISSSVKRSQLAEPRVWLVSTVAIDLDEVTPADQYRGGRVGQADTWTEGLALAAQQRAEIEADLLDEVHASRASRRPTAPQSIAACSSCGHPATEHLGIICPDSTSSDIHTLEATA